MDREAKISKDQVAATLAHEIRNPLALIKASLQYIELSDKGDLYKKNYNVIYREIDRINDMVVEYLDAAKPKKLYLKKFNIIKLIDEIDSLFTMSLAEKNITLEISIIDANIEIMADYNKIKQVLVNIIQNAKEAIESQREKHAAEGKKEMQGLITVSAFKTEGIASIKISDNGSGITEKDLKSIGTPFFSTKKTGTGLGISISKGIIHMHKGTISVAGVENKGTTVSVSLPVYTSRGNKTDLKGKGVH